MPTEVASVKSRGRGDDTSTGMTGGRGTLEQGRRTAVAAAVMMIFATGPARAGGFDLDFFKPTMPSTGTFCEENGLTVPRERLDLAVAGGYAYRPLVVDDQKTGTATGDVVRERIVTTLIAGYGITDRVDVGLRLAAVARQSGGQEVDIAADGGIPQRPTTSALGDTDLLARVALVHEDRPEKRIRLTLLMPLGVPTGHADALSGSGHFSFRPRLIAGWHWPRLAFSASVGFVYTPPVEVPNSALVVGKAAEAGMGLAYAVLPARLWVLAEVTASLGMEQSATGIGTAVTQFLAGARVLLPADLLLQAGLGSGLTHAAGSPRFAATVGLARLWTFR